jgi:hypothetical protein
VTVVDNVVVAVAVENCVVTSDVDPRTRVTVSVAV